MDRDTLIVCWVFSIIMTMLSALVGLVAFAVVGLAVVAVLTVLVVRPCSTSRELQKPAGVKG